MAALDESVRLHVYRHFIDVGRPPTVNEAAESLGSLASEVERSFRRFGERHVLVLAPKTTEILMAMPFSVVPTSF